MGRKISTLKGKEKRRVYSRKSTSLEAMKDAW